MVSHSHVKYVHPVTLELDTNLESGTCLRISGAWTQIHCQNQLIKIAITNLYSQKSLKQTTRKNKKHEKHMKEPNIQNYMCLKNGTSMSSGFDPFHRSSLPSLAPADQVPFSRHRCTGRWWLTVPPGMMRWPPKMGPIIGGWIQCGFYFHHKLCFGTWRCSCGYIYNSI